ncbi:MAG TPA: ABC transporter permease [Rhodothermales bacterium]|nr:ABC transporter permease [Rhodothermales bacterium]
MTPNPNLPRTALDQRILATLAVPPPAARAGALANTLTFGWRALLKIKHMPEQVFDVVVTPIMFTVLFTYLFGGALAGSTKQYLQFLLPGILVQTVTFTSIYTGFTLNTDLSKGVYDRFRSMPIWSLSPIVGAMGADTVRHTVSTLIALTVGLVMGFRPPTGVTGVVLSILLLDLYAFGIGWVFTTVALVVRSPSTVMTLSWLVLMPLTFASNVFVDPATMPGWLQAFVSVNPVALLVTAVRGLMAGTATLEMIGMALLAPAIVAAVCAPLAMVLYRRKR